MSTCSICVDDTESPACCVPCGHVYCRDCIDNWQKLKQSVSKCPECREEIQNVVTIYIKKDDSKDEALMKKLDALQSTLMFCDQEKSQLERNLLENRNECERLTDQLEEQKKQTDMYKDKFHTCSKEKIYLKRKIQNLTRREEKIRNDCEISLIEEREKSKTLKRKKEHLQETMANCHSSMKTLKDTIRQQKDDIQRLENQWLMKLLKSTDKVKMLWNCVSTLVTISAKKYVGTMKSLAFLCGEALKKLWILCLQMIGLLINILIIAVCLKSFYDYEYLMVVMAYFFIFVVVISVCFMIPPLLPFRQISYRFREPLLIRIRE